MNWGDILCCSFCRCEETLLADTERNRKHWAYGKYKTQSQREYDEHCRSLEHVSKFVHLKCEACEVQCWNKCDFEKHCASFKHRVKTKAPLRCELCGYESTTNWGMKQHCETQKHKDRVAGVQKEVHRCEACDFTAEFKSELDQHERTQKHREKVGLPAEAQEFVCECCAYSTQFKQNYDRHLRSSKHLLKHRYG